MYNIFLHYLRVQFDTDLDTRRLFARQSPKSEEDLEWNEATDCSLPDYSIVLFNLVLYIEVPIYIRLVTIDIFGMKITLCGTSTLWFGEAINIISLIQGSVLPSLILFGSSIFTIKPLRDSRRNVNIAVDKRRARENKYACFHHFACF